MDSKDPDIHVLDKSMLATKTHPACHCLSALLDHSPVFWFVLGGFCLFVLEVFMGVFFALPLQPEPLSKVGMWLPVQELNFHESCKYSSRVVGFFFIWGTKKRKRVRVHCNVYLTFCALSQPVWIWFISHKWWTRFCLVLLVCPLLYV